MPLWDGFRVHERRGDSERMRIKDLRNSIILTTIILLVIPRFLDIVSPNHGCISVIIIAGISRKVHFSEELLLMMLEFSDHIGSIDLSCRCVWSFAERSNNFRKSSARKKVSAALRNCNARPRPQTDDMVLVDDDNDFRRRESKWCLHRFNASMRRGGL